MAFLEKIPALTARSILKFVQSDAAKGLPGWFINTRCQNHLFGDQKYSKQLKYINEQLEQIKQDTSSRIKEKTDWEHLHTRISQAEMGICQKFKHMQTILKIENSIERCNEALVLTNDILDTESGVLSNLSVIHQGLVGHTDTNTTEKGLLELWSNEMYNNMSINRMSSKIYLDYVDKYLTQAAIIQFKGILLFAGATSNTRLCLHQFDLYENNLKSQIETMQNTVPSSIKYLSDPDENKVFILRPVFDGKDQPFVKRKGPNRRLANDYLCGIPEAGKWVLKTSSDFDKDGSLLFSGSTKEKYDQYYYMSLSKTKKAKCVAGIHRATPFYVIPLDYTDKKIRILICKSKSETRDKLFLGNNLKFIDDHDNIEFIVSFVSV